MRRIGVVTRGALETDADLQALYAVCGQALQQLGWTEGRNIKFGTSALVAPGDSDVVRRHAAGTRRAGANLIVAFAGSQEVWRRCNK